MVAVTELLAKNGIKVESTAPGQYYALCPQCSATRKKASDKCLGVKIDDKGACWRCNHCDWSGPERNGTGKGGDKQSEQKSRWTTLAKYIYRDADGKPFLLVRKCLDENGNKQYPQSHWNGEAWMKGKPMLNGKAAPKIPYRLPQLIAAPLTARIYFCEGEKDVDALAKLGFTATTASEGASAKWVVALTPYFKDRHIVVLPDADKPGRAHAQKVAKAINEVAASVRVLDLYPERSDGSDVSDWIADDTAGAKLVKLAKDVPLWEPPAEADKAGDGDSAAGDTDANAEIERLAKLGPLDYEHARETAAKKLGIKRLSVLDSLVKAKRRELGLDGGDDKQGRKIEFPAPALWPEPISGAGLLNAFAGAIRKHVVMSTAASHVAALWGLHSWLINCFVISPRLCVRSATKGCGKTLFLDVIGRLVRRPLRTLSITPAATFRVVEGWQPTLLIDEADTFLNDNDGLRGILDGNRRGDTVTRTVGDQHEVRVFATYSAVSIALIGTLPDTLHDRSVVVELKRRLPRERIAPFRFDRAGHLDVLARMCARWALDNAERITHTEPQMPAGVINREADNWRPLAAIAEVAGGRWPARVGKAAGAAHAAAATGDEDASMLEMALADIRDAFATDNAITVRDVFGAERLEIASAVLVKVLVAIEGRPWAEMGRDRKPMTPSRLARMLKPLKIKPSDVGPKDARVKGYRLDQFAEAFARYLEGGSHPRTRAPADEMGVSGDSKPRTQNNGCADATAQKLAKNGHLRGCADAKGEKPLARARPRSDDLPYTGPVVATPDLGPDPLDEHGAPRAAEPPPTNGGEPGLSRRRIQELAGWYQDARHRRYSDDNLDTPALDAELRMILREEAAFPEHVEVEFERVMQIVSVV